MTMREYQVTGMTCGHCETTIREEVSQIVGIQSIDVSAKTGKLVVTSQAELDDTAVLAAVAEAGYGAVRVP
ncbi:MULTISPECIES: heavy-metal-associated domain-containing protein [unclassified Cryobacterium]|uniref:heavy-metal-associated domain-containing protein n=1 Tax=unclassified Cryobacterium TaxID=2649013 RepID=UPI00106C416D|nr:MULTISPECIES: heavy metal-associated domain-containing protein [unclassified Cryobacterium]TFD04523.1 heavy-metal-associated domain-containing protein [Cryobacterium sp. TMT1-66-1]TFD08527.1 heavy-metal-associated domain-containing protein [Cryobacterium sp. TMT1-2-2]